jgi:type VI secretion system secreted protein Hcp
MADMYLKIDGIPGEATDADHKDWIEIHSFNHSITQTASATSSSAGGGTTSRTNHADFVVTHLVDKASPKLYEAASSGKHINNVSIELFRAAGDKRVKYMEITLGQVVISNVAPSSNGDFPAESVSLNYGTIKWVYTLQKRSDGSPSGSTTGGWDLTQHKTIA